MPSITSGRDATLLQLQYLTDSLGLRRTYLDSGVDAPERDTQDSAGKETAIDKLDCLLKPNPIRSLVQDVSRPDIEWYPNYDTHQARVERLAKSAHDRPETVPEGFPRQIVSPRVWTGSDFVDKDKYRVQLSADDIQEIRAALEYFKGLDGDHGPGAVSTDTFPLPGLKVRLASVAQNIHRGTGFNVIRGLDPTEFSPLDNVLIYLGITSYIAEIRGCQDYDGRMIVHIKDIEKELPDASGRPSPYTNRAQPFHTDMCDILSMYVLDVADQGGESLLASSAMIYNEIAATRPDIIHVLSDDRWIHDDFHKIKASWTSRPLLYNFEKHGPSFLYSRRPLTGAPFSPHRPDVPAMTEEQAEAIDAVHFTAVKHQLVIKLEPGDIEIFNNMALFHARNGFKDHGKTSEAKGVGEARLLVQDNSGPVDRSVLRGTRHMLRLWLRSADEELAWKTPEQLAHNSHEIYGDSEARKIERWDVHRAPPINRILTKHFKCS
ncbi:Clavaminate synthase [Fusarium albosuccineum]|uniref:Clavaminate synthase n=1 Tax=Fusarium albosuccineum TaxID=1237068 RepID=A0A8H4PDI5_9HYPO|nr:Clavaminate synthase [Fusarium albosuccineum]